MYVITVPMVTFTIQNRVFHFGDGLVQRGLSWFKNEEKGEAAAVEFKTLFRILKKHLAHEIIFAAHS